MKWKERFIMVLLLSAICILLYFRNKLSGKISHPVIQVNVDEIVNSINKDLMKSDIKSSINGLPVSMHAWDVWDGMVTNRGITTESETLPRLILTAMAKSKILKADVGYKGTQLKALLTLEGPQDQLVVFKPKRYTRDKILDGTPYEGYDRHNAEIAAFHLDRLLGFYRAPPAVGRYIDLKSEIIPVCKKKLLNTFFTQEENICFYGVCMYCNVKEPACAKGNAMEGSLTLWLPPKWKVAKLRHPWQRTYNKRKKAKWEVDTNYCESVVKKPPYNEGPRLLDIMDTAIFDFLIGNADRHHYEYIGNDNNNGMMLHMDNGKSFGNPNVDEKSILAPIYQCCRLRHSTYERLKMFAANGNASSLLSFQLEKRLKNDPIYPIITHKHLSAIDRRLKIVFDTLQNCFDIKGKHKVLFN